MTTTDIPEIVRERGDLHVERWGAGARVVLVHGSLALGAEEWEQQRPLAEEGFELVVPDRRGYGQSPPATGEDFLRDAEDIAELMGLGAHLVGHSYGGLGVLIAAARRPEATLSLTVLEPGAFGVADDDDAARILTEAVRTIWAKDGDDAAWVVEFLKAVGSDPDEFPPEFLALALPLVPLIREGRAPWEADLPLAELAEATFPKVVVSGGHNAGFEAMCDGIALRIGGARAKVEGAGHEIQFAAPAINDLLRSTWRGAERLHAIAQRVAR